MSGPDACGLCKRNPAEGFAEINGVRYCHGEQDWTCYMQAGGGVTAERIRSASKQNATGAVPGLVPSRPTN